MRKQQNILDMLKIYLARIHLTHWYFQQNVLNIRASFGWASSKIYWIYWKNIWSKYIRYIVIFNKIWIHWTKYVENLGKFWMSKQQNIYIGYIEEEKIFSLNTLNTLIFSTKYGHIGQNMLNIWASFGWARSKIYWPLACFVVFWWVVGLCLPLFDENDLNTIHLQFCIITTWISI